MQSTEQPKYKNDVDDDDGNKMKNENSELRDIMQR